LWGVGSWGSNDTFFLMAVAIFFRKKNHYIFYYLSQDITCIFLLSIFKLTSLKNDDISYSACQNSY